MGRLSMGTRDELLAAAGRRYAEADRRERGRVLDELTSLTGLHRKHAARLLRGGSTGTRHEARPQRRIYDDAVREALVVMWEASDRVCGKRLQPLMPILVEAMERHGHLQLASEVRSGLLALSAATIDRALRDIRARSGNRPRRRAPRRPQSGEASPCEPSRAGMTHRPASWKQTWSRIAARWPRAVSCRR